MRSIKKTVPMFNRFYMMKMCALACLIVAAALVLAIIPAFCDGMKPVQLGPVLLLSTPVLGLFMLWTYAKHRDPRRLMMVGERYTAAQFLHEPHFCESCGTRRILTVFGEADSPVVPNTLLGNLQTNYYCPRCGDAVSAAECVSAGCAVVRLWPGTFRADTGILDEFSWRPSRRYVRLHGSLLLLSLCICGAAAFLVKLHCLFLPVWWAALYLVFLFFYHMMDNLLLAYWIGREGLVQRSLVGFRFLRWEEINQVTETATQGGSGKMTLVFAQSGNWVLSPVLESYEDLTDSLKEMCKKHRIPYGEEP